MMRIGTNVSVLLAALTCVRVFKGAQGLTDRNPSCDRLDCPGDSYDFDGFAYDVSQVNCTALVTIYDLATDNNTDPEIFFDGYKDPYQTTGVLSLQLELEDLQPEDVDILTLSYDLKIYNPLYNYLVWTSSYAVIALGDIDRSSPHGEGIIDVYPFFNDGNPGLIGQRPGYFNMGIYSDAPKTLHTYDTDVLAMALLPERVTLNEVACDVVLACQGNDGDLFPC